MKGWSASQPIRALLLPADRCGNRRQADESDRFSRLRRDRYTAPRRSHAMRFASGARLGPFEILAPLGAGGMGEVYRARDTRLDRTVAIKLLPSELVDAPGRRVERFRHEARAIARITHPNICTLHDVGEDGPAIFLVMEYVEGVTLARAARGRPSAAGPRVAHRHRDRRCAGPRASTRRGAQGSQARQRHADARQRQASRLWLGQVEGTRRGGAD